MTVAPDFHSGVPALEDSSVSYVCNSDAAKCIKMRVPGDHVAQGAAWSSEPMAWHVLRRSFDCLRVPSCQGERLSEGWPCTLTCNHSAR